MSQSTFGKKFTVTTWGESHGKALGAVVDGVPAGLFLTETDIQAYLDRRKPGQSRYTTARNEGDEVEILSGVFEGQTTGTPISMIVRNKDQRSHDYGNIANTYRPGHADFGFDSKYGIRDYRGGGRSSGRETIGRVAAGAIAAKILKELGITLQAYTNSIGPVFCQTYHPEVIRENSFYMPDMVAAKNAIKYLESCMRKDDSAGGVIECGEILLRAHIKPTPSISKPQQTVTKTGEDISIEIKGRHDPVIVPRAVVVVESMAAITLVDAMFSNMSARMDYLKDFYL